MKRGQTHTIRTPRRLPQDMTAESVWCRSHINSNQNLMLAHPRTFSTAFKCSDGKQTTTTTLRSSTIKTVNSNTAVATLQKGPSVWFHPVFRPQIQNCFVGASRCNDVSQFNHIFQAIVSFTETLGVSRTIQQSGAGPSASMEMLYPDDPDSATWHHDLERICRDHDWCAGHMFHRYSCQIP